MSRNIEIKAKVNLSIVEEKVKKLQNISNPEIIIQEDVFFFHNEGRLKLRKFTNGNSELIFYKRSDDYGPKTSDYQIYKSSNTSELESFLNNSFGMRGIVKKIRKLYLYKNTRIHLDKVDNLGEFLELEVMVIENYSLHECQKIADELISYLEITNEMLIDKAYIDLLEDQN